MFNPKEAREDGYILSAALALLIAAGAFVLLNVSFPNGLRIGLLLLDHSEATASIVTSIENAHAGRTITYHFQGEDGQQHEGAMSVADRPEYDPGKTIELAYNRNYPEYQILPEKLDDAWYDFYVSCGLILLIILCLLYFLRQSVRYVRFKRRMKTY